MRIPAAPQVIIRACKDYDVATLRKIYREGLEELGLKPSGRTLVKPNLVAAGEMFPYAFTRPECGEAMLLALFPGVYLITPLLRFDLTVELSRYVREREKARAGGSGRSDSGSVA